MSDTYKANILPNHNQCQSLVKSGVKSRWGAFRLANKTAIHNAILDDELEDFVGVHIKEIADPWDYD